MSLEFYARDLRLATEQLTGEAINAELARFAREELHKAIQAGEASDQFDRFVNAQRGLAEEAVIAPGPIVYVFNDWPVIILSALAELQKRAPRRSGRYAQSFVVLANGRVVSDYKNIAADAEVIIFNARPQTRRIEVGAKQSAGKRHFDAAKRAVSRRFGNIVNAETRFLNIAAGVHPLVPYVLRTSGGRRKGRQAGDHLTYPAIVMNYL